MKREISLVFPNQLFEESVIHDLKLDTYLIEENLFFRHFNFHKQKLLFHRSSMMHYKNFLKYLEINVNYIESSEEISDVRKFILSLENDVDKIHLINPVDNYLERRIKSSCKKKGIQIVLYNNPSFINNEELTRKFFREDKKKFFHMNFYKEQRIDLGILIDNSNPVGGKWSYDDMNRMRFPKEKKPPKISYPEENIIYKEAKAYVEKEFENNVGEIHDHIVYPFDFKSAKKWFNDFLKNRFYDFGPYEDAVVKDERVLNHSLLSPLINSGLLNPKFIINESIRFYKKHNIPLNSCEGFIRQIIGWREFIRGVYEIKGSYERTHNFWNFSRKIPKSFYNGTTGIEPVDDSIKKVIKSAYSHHIERLMVIGNFMLLCEFDPDEVYRWFMELYIDAYDWVMVPNVYGMSQFADGGLMSTKPYISGSSYILKMSDYKKGEWCEVWDGLFWNFMNKQRDFFIKNPRMRMLISSFDKMDESKRNIHLKNAESFLKKLDK
jgi:deoxyribodipyrimidine photolyase-related protein